LDLRRGFLDLLNVVDLEVGYTSDGRCAKAVDQVSVNVAGAEAVGLAGESGCGKTTLALSVMRLLPPGGRILGGKILFDRQDVTTLSDAELRKVRWKEISMVFQGAMNALNPVHKVGNQIVEAIALHETMARSEAVERTKNLFRMVGLDPSRIGDYPHQFSGGMKQRAIIAMALACNPKLVIADEPVTALDVIVQDQILKLLKKLQKELGLSMILISHDLSVVAQTCDRVAIMYAGKIVEYADVVSIFDQPAHPYTQALVSAFPSIRRSQKLKVIPGFPPNLMNPPSGCRFHPRCPMTTDLCVSKLPTMIKVKNGHYAACHLVQEEQKAN
jgi:peptide/nickel transport system ATP-binding protein